MDIPNKVKYIIERILKSEDRWKALYMATWGCSYQIKAQFEKTEFWEKTIPFGLPASKNKQHVYKPKELYSILTSRDGEFTIGHLQTLFSLFEELLNEASKILFNFELDTSKWKNMKEFFNQDDTKDILTKKDINELKLAKETRNCFIHNGSKVDKRWLDAYRDARGVTTVSLSSELQKGFSNIFHQIENWHELIVNITKKIEGKIIQK